MFRMPEKLLTGRIVQLKAFWLGPKYMSTSRRWNPLVLHRKLETQTKHGEKLNTMNPRGKICSLSGKGEGLDMDNSNRYGGELTYMSILLVEGVAISWMRTFVLVFLQPLKVKTGLKIFKLWEMGQRFWAIEEGGSQTRGGGWSSSEESRRKWPTGSPGSGP